ncbi:MAG: DUF6516 family protein [Caldilineales bacterium]
MIQAYFDQLKHIVDSYAAASFVLDARVSFELRPGDQGYLLGSMLFLDQSLLHFREYLDVAEGRVNRLSYSYHYQDSEDRLVFRYDNALHRPALLALEHKHSGDTIVASPAPSLEVVLSEIAGDKGWIEEMAERK